MTFRITGLPRQTFEHLAGLDDEALTRHGARRVIADNEPGFPDRIELREARRGEALLLVNHQHQGANTPYRAAHAVYVLEQPGETFDRVGRIPPVLRPRLLSLRAFDAGHMMVDADVTEGREVEPLIERLLADPRVEYLQVHFAKRGCYACRVERAALST